jgi:putative transposase
MDVAQEKPETVILAGDEASLYLQATTMRVWAPVGQTPIVRVHTGRENTNIYGCLNLQTGMEIVMQAETMNSVTTADYLQMIADTIPGKPILLLWDRAPWHRGPAVREFLAANPRFEIVWLPPGAPDLNPQEQVWKRTREHISHNHQQTQLKQLADAFATYLTNSVFKSAFLERYGYPANCPSFN